jgi:serine/threonine protein kinase
MNAEQWTRLRELFHEALDRDAEGRAALLSDLADEDPGVRAELESLLSRSPMPGFLEQPFSVETEAEFEVDHQLGAYRIVRELGRGGMGIVFEAVREEDGISQPVAIKVLRAPLLDREYARQFRQERQALSQLEHPNIARLLDWGETPARRAFLVIEFVRDAVPIDEYCSINQLSRRRVLELFLAVCDAVSHAHRHLVVHRDIKPANVMVTKDGWVKLLDFGIAKLLDPARDTTATLLRRMTPDYASPEQLSGAPITTASDVYSLGVLLHELLTGQLPKNGVLARSLRGDIENILLKALAAEPEQRYKSVDAFSRDLQNRIRGRPVEARGYARWYLISTFVRRHRGALAAALITVLSLGIGTGIAAWKANEASVQYRSAQERAKDLQEISRSLIFELHDAIAGLQGSEPALQELVRVAQRYLNKLNLELPDDDSVQFDVAAAYIRLAQIEQHSFAKNLGNQGALENFEKAVEVLRKSWIRHPLDVEIGRRLFESATAVADLESDPGHALIGLNSFAKMANDLDLAHPQDRRAICSAAAVHQERSRLLLGIGEYTAAQADALQAIQLGQQAMSIGQVAPLFGNSAESIDSLFALRDFTEAVHLGDETNTAESIDILRQLGDSYVLSAQAAANMGDLQRANETIKTARAYVIKGLVADPAIVALKRTTYVLDRQESEVSLALGNLALAEKESTDSLRLATEMGTVNSRSFEGKRDLAIAHRQKGRVLMKQGRSIEAINHFQSAITLYSQMDSSVWGYRAEKAAALDELGMAFVAAQETQRAGTLFRQSLDLSQQPGENIELMRECARAYRGVAFATPSKERSVESLRRSLEYWAMLRRQSPEDRSALIEQSATESALQTLLESDGMRPAR